MGGWLTLTLISKDRLGIVKKINRALFYMQGNLRDASMTRLGSNFTIMLMV